MKSRTKQVTSALSPVSAGSTNYPSINSTYWLPTSNPTPYVLPGLCCTKCYNYFDNSNCLLHFNHFHLTNFINGMKNQTKNPVNLQFEPIVSISPEHLLCVLVYFSC